MRHSQLLELVLAFLVLLDQVLNYDRLELGDEEPLNRVRSTNN